MTDSAIRPPVTVRVEQLTSTAFCLYANVEINLGVEVGHLKVRQLRLHPSAAGYTLANPSSRTPAGEMDVVTLPKRLRPLAEPRP